MRLQLSVVFTPKKLPKNLIEKIQSGEINIEDIVIKSIKETNTKVLLELIDSTSKNADESYIVGAEYETMLCEEQDAY